MAAFSGYLGFGVLTAGVFVEASDSGYARQVFAMGAPFEGKTEGTGAICAFGAGPYVAFNALAMYAASSGGSPVFVYPLPASRTIAAGVSLNVAPSHIAIDYINFTTLHGVAITDQVGAVALGTGALLPCETGITAHAGGTQAAARALVAAINTVDTVGSAADSVRLPTWAQGLRIYVVNTTGTSLQVYGAGTDTINAVATATGVAVAANKTGLFLATTQGLWRGVLALA